MTGTPLVLAADVGGTRTKLALACCDEEQGLRFVERAAYASGEFPAFERILDAFLSEPAVAPYASQVCTACFAVAGPVKDGAARLTNLTWSVDERSLAQHLGIRRVSVINDFAAAGLGIDLLTEADLLTLQTGAPIARGNRIILGAGTGLGVAWLTWNEDRYRVHSSEGGHADFAPIDDTQLELWRYLRQRFDHVSAERVVSGSGLERIFSFVQESEAARPSTALLDAMAQGDDAGAISQFALERRDSLAERALDVFASAYGAFAGSMALMALARGGVYLAGGIAPKIAVKLQDGTFIRSFTAKGRFRPLLETVPVRVVMNESTGLLGAIAQATRAAREPQPVV
jgi:glucokinase